MPDGYFLLIVTSLVRIRFRHLSGESRPIRSNSKELGAEAKSSHCRLENIPSALLAIADFEINKFNALCWCWSEKLRWMTHAMFYWREE